MLKKLGIGRMSERITIEEYTNTRHPDTGDVIKSWVTFTSCWSEVYPKGSFKPNAEKEESDRLTAISEDAFRIRFIEGVTEKMRILYDSKYYYIVSISKESDKRKFYLKIVTEKRDASDGRD